MRRKISVNYINSCLIGQRVSIDCIVKENVFILLQIAPIQEFKEGKPTKNIVGYSYECVDTNKYDRYLFKTEQDKPIMDNDELQKRREDGEKFFIEVIGGSVSAYVSLSGSIEDSFKADDVKLTKVLN